jgi:hypothetical protein
MNMRSWLSSFRERGNALASFLFDKLLKNENAKVKNTSKINSSRKKIWLVSLVVVFAVIVIFSVEYVHAQQGLINATGASKMVANWAIAIVAKVIIWLAEMMGLILIFLIDLLIKIVQYNNFVKATPVQIGWPLIRDTVNMFFIVVVLVSAFATIIGYPKEFRYREVLPKLLLMAVLINFSKTLIGLMIDFSQVVLLTFVNGFKQAAGGNFVQALGIAKIMRLTDTTGAIEENKATGEIEISMSAAGSANSPWSLMSIVVAAVFAVWIISISITLILVMVIFFLARIIMLWFLLITSPIAFFAWSLPGSLKNALSSFTNEWWSRLSNALIGGPTMAFFLWLSLAMAQRHGDLVGPGGIYDHTQVSSEVTNMQAQAGQKGFVAPTEFGDPENFATFIIMVAFMLLGVQVSVKFASSVAPGSDKLLKMVGAGSLVGGGVAGLLAAGKMAGKATAATARTTGRVAVGGAKIAGKGALLAGGEVAKRTDLAQKMVGGLRKSGITQLMPERAQVALGGVAGYHLERAKKKETDLNKTMSGMTAVERDSFLNNKLELLKKNPLSDNADILATQSLIGKNASTELFHESAMKLNRERAEKELGHGTSAEVIEARALLYTGQMKAASTKNMKDVAIAANDEETLEKVNKMKQKRPELESDYDLRSELLNDLASNPKQISNISDDSYSEAFNTWKLMFAKGFVDDTGRLVPGASQMPGYDDLMKGKQGSYIKAHLEYAKTDQGKKAVKAILDPARKDGKIDTNVLNNNNYHVSLSRGGKEFHVVSDSDANSRYHAKFDKTTDDPNKIFSEEQFRNKAIQLMPALGPNAEVKHIGTELSKPFQAEFVRDLEELKTQQESGDADGYNTKRDEMAKKYLAQGVSAEAFIDRDKESGNFRSSAGAESFERVMKDFLDKIENNTITNDNSINALTNLLEQTGAKGEAGQKAMEMLAKSMQSGKIDHSKLYDLVTTGSTEQKKSIRKAFAQFADQAQKDDESLKTNTVAQALRQELQRTPQGGDTPQERAAREDAHNLRNILIYGKKNP